jgi:hypothetical protein
MTVSALLGLVIWLLVVGLILWIVTLVIDRVPMDATFKQVAKAIVLVIGLIILLLQVIPLVSSLG